MAAYQTFTTARPTEPDLSALLATLRGQDASAGIQHAVGSPTYVVKKNTGWTAPQIAFAQNAIDTAPATTALSQYTRTSREKDVLATMAMIVRARNIAAWNAMTTPQKITATLAEADAWVTIRDFLETNG